MSFFIRTSRLTSSAIRSATITTASSRTTSAINNTITPIAIRGFKNTSANMGVHNLNRAEFQAAISDNKIVVLDAFATWCGPCKVIAPQVVKFSDEYPGAHFVKVDVDEVPDVAQELGIRAMPTFLVFKDGTKVQEVVGANPKALEAAIKGAIEV